MLSMLHKLPSSSQLHRVKLLSSADTDIRVEEINSSPRANPFDIDSKVGC
uniref:Uncharacterized protein n=1 Tax=Rhizophora mucronata TaxID=61149 RepID=A0A2P2NWK8_RHIMU